MGIPPRYESPPGMFIDSAESSSTSHSDHEARLRSGMEDGDQYSTDDSLSDTNTSGSSIVSTNLDQELELFDIRTWDPLLYNLH